MGIINRISSMPMSHKSHVCGVISSADKHNRPVRRCDLVELVLEPLSSQVDRARQEILEKVQKIQDSTEIMARQMRRQIPE